MSDDTKALIAITALNKMFAGAHFSICTIDSIAEMLGVIPDGEARRQLKPLHCMDWSDMPRDLRQRVPILIQQALAGDEKFRFVLNTEQNQALTVIDGCKHTRRPLLTRLLGK